MSPIDAMYFDLTSKEYNLKLCATGFSFICFYINQTHTVNIYILFSSNFIIKFLHLLLSHKVPKTENPRINMEALTEIWVLNDILSFSISFLSSFVRNRDRKLGAATAEIETYSDQVAT